MIAPVLADSAYHCSSPLLSLAPPTYTTPLSTVAEEVIPCFGGTHGGSVIVPRKVFQITAPVFAFIAYS